MADSGKRAENEEKHASVLYNVEKYRACIALHRNVRTLKFINIYLFLWVRSHKENKEK